MQRDTEKLDKRQNSVHQNTVLYREKEESIVVYDEQIKGMRFVSKDSSAKGDKTQLTKLTPESPNVQRVTKCCGAWNRSVLFPLAGTNLLLNLREVAELLAYNVSLYSANKSSVQLVQEIPFREMMNHASDFSFNKRRALLAGVSDVERSVAYHLWRLDSGKKNETLTLLRKTAMNKSNQRSQQTLTSDFESSSSSNGDGRGYNLSMDFENSGELIATISTNDQLEIYTVNSNERRFCCVLDYPCGVESICSWSPDSNKIFVAHGSQNPRFEFIDIETKTFSLSGTSFKIKSLDISEFNPSLVACALSRDGEVIIFDLRKSTYFPVAHLEHGESNTEIDSYFSLDGDVPNTYLHRPKKPTQWSRVSEYQLLSLSLSEVALLDTRKYSSALVVSNEKKIYSSACFIERG